MSIERAREKEKSIYRQVNRDVNRMPRRERITRGHVAPAGKVVAIGDSRLLTCNSKIAMHLPQKAILPYPRIFSIPIILKLLTNHKLNYNFESTTFILTLTHGITFQRLLSTLKYELILTQLVEDYHQPVSRIMAQVSCN